MTSSGKSRRTSPDRAEILAERVSEALLRERIVPRFVDSYVIEHGRHALQVHAGQYRDLLTIIQREALLAMSAQALETACGRTTAWEERPIPPMTRKDATTFRHKFLTALTLQQSWNVGTALEFQSDLRMYEDILARAHPQRRSRKPFEATNHPFVDRCGFMLDSSFLENARLAASRALTDLETLATQLTVDILKDRASD